MRSHSCAVSSGTDVNDTLNGTLANAAAKPADLGMVYAGLAPRTNASGTVPAFIFSTAPAKSAYDARPLKPPCPSAGLMVVPTEPAFLLMSATMAPQSTALAVVTPQIAMTPLPAAVMALAKASSVAAGTPEASDAAAIVPAPVSAAQICISLPGLAAIH